MITAQSWIKMWYCKKKIITSVKIYYWNIDVLRSSKYYILCLYVFRCMKEYISNTIRILMYQSVVNIMYYSYICSDV